MKQGISEWPKGLGTAKDLGLEQDDLVERFSKRIVDNEEIIAREIGIFLGYTLPEQGGVIRFLLRSTTDPDRANLVGKELKIHPLFQGFRKIRSTPPANETPRDVLHEDLTADMILVRAGYYNDGKFNNLQGQRFHLRTSLEGQYDQVTGTIAWANFSNTYGLVIRLNCPTVCGHPVRGLRYKVTADKNEGWYMSIERGPIEVIEVKVDEFDIIAWR